MSLIRNGDKDNRMVATTDSEGNFEFKIEFEKVETKCFTLVVGDKDIGNCDWRWPEKYTEMKCWYCPYRYYSAKDVNGQYCGNFPAKEWGDKHYNYRGWSSAVCGDDTCSVYNLDNPWFGGEDFDRLCVTPGGEVTQNIKLIKVPTATVEGYVKDEKGNPLSASIYIRWHNYYCYRICGRYYKTDSNGYYKVTVPAEQELFPNDEDYYVKLLVYVCLASPNCCKCEYRAKYFPVGPLYQGTKLEEENLVFSYPTTECGNLEGYVKDAKTGAPIKDARVNVGNDYAWTNGEGYYVFKCKEEEKDKYRVAVGEREIHVSKKDYYTFDSDDSMWYADQPEVNIEKGEIAKYNIKLWPKSYGGLKVIVKAGPDEDAPRIKDATVKIYYYDEYIPQFEGSTNENGIVEFSHVLETWPPDPDATGFPADEDDELYGYFKHDTYLHKVVVTYSGKTKSKDVKVIAGQITKVEFIFGEEGL